MAHDEGPLTIREGGPEHDYAIIDAEHGYILGEAYRHVGTSAFKDAEANARLWVAAPDLLAACEDAEQYLEAVYRDAVAREVHNTKERYAPQQFAQIRDSFDRLRAAVAKARGT